jgi:membrane protease YdiL (CAAX protease family)
VKWRISFILAVIEEPRELLNHFNFATYGLLTLSIVMLWTPTGKSSPKGIGLWVIPFVLSLAMGLSAGLIHPPALLWITIFGLACYQFSTESSAAIRALAGIAIVVLSIGLMAHVVPGFSNVKVISELVLSTDGIPYTLYLSYDRALVGLFILAFCRPLLTTKEQWMAMLKTFVPLAFALLSLVTLLATAIGYVRWEVKFPQEFLIWAWVNLFFTCVAEEAFFRGFLQKHLEASLIGVSHGPFVALAIASLLFGFAHYAGGMSYVILASIAGLGYGWAYQRTRRIEASILTHFSLNAAHFVFFTYPALRSGVSETAA